MPREGAPRIAQLLPGVALVLAGVLAMGLGSLLLAVLPGPIASSQVGTVVVVRNELKEAATVGLLAMGKDAETARWSPAIVLRVRGAPPLERGPLVVDLAPGEILRVEVDENDWDFAGVALAMEGRPAAFVPAPSREPGSGYREVVITEGNLEPAPEGLGEALEPVGRLWWVWHVVGGVGLILAGVELIRAGVRRDRRVRAAA
jgi:hypothetical protein